MPFVLLRLSAELCHKFFFVYNKAFVRAFADLLVLVGGGNFKTSLRPLTAVSVAVAVTFLPMPVAASCVIFTKVPTLVDSSSRQGSTALQAACSISAIMLGVAKTCRLPLPMASAVLVSRTMVSAVPVRPGLILA